MGLMLGLLAWRDSAVHAFFRLEPKIPEAPAHEGRPHDVNRSMDDSRSVMFCIRHPVAMVMR